MSNSKTKQDEYKQIIGRKIAEYRKLAGFSQARLAEMVPCSSDQISRIERGIQDPTFQVVCSISDKLEVTPNDLCPPELLVSLRKKAVKNYAIKRSIDSTDDFAVEIGKVFEPFKKVLRELHPMYGKPESYLEDFILFCVFPKSTRQLMEFFHMKSNSHFRKYILYPLLRKGYLHRTVPEKPSSPRQQYYLDTPKENIEEEKSQLLREN